MARQFSPTQFFRRVPNALLGRYFQELHESLLDIDFAQLKPTQVEPVFTAYTALPDDLQADIEAECQEIESMACQAGISALADEAHFHGDTQFAKAISKFDGFHDAAMWAFLEHRDYWPGASLFLHSDNISESFWKKRNDLPHLPPGVEDEDLDAFAHAISRYFHSKEGRGRNCKVEVFRRHDKEYFFAYPEDYAQSGIEWIRNKLDNRSRHPAFEIIFVYCQKEGSLDIYAPGNSKYVEDLQEMFAQSILKYDDLPGYSGRARVYALDKLANRYFTFKYDLDRGSTP